MRLPIRWRLILSIGLPLMAVYVAVLLVAFWTLRETAYRNAERHIQQVALHHAARFDAKLQAVAQVARSMATFLTSTPNVTETELFEMLQKNVEQNELIYGSCIAFEPQSYYKDRGRFAPYVWRGGKDGALSRMDVMDAYDYADGTWEWYSLPKKLGVPVWTEPFFDEGRGNVIMCTHAAPFYKDDKFWGIATIDVKLEDLQKGASDSDLEGGWFVILSRNGTFISHPDPSFILKETTESLGKKYNQPDVDDLHRRLLAGEQGVRLMPRFPNNKPHFIAYAPIESADWQFCATIPEAYVLAPVWWRLAEFSAVMLAGLILIGAILLFAAFRITLPMRRLVAAAGRISSGNLDARAVGVDSNDEIGDLGRAFNRMVVNLKEHVEARARDKASREIVEAELKVAREIQSSLLPRKFPPYPERAEFDLHAVNLPARMVAGDFYDFFFISDDVLVIVIADISGKGVPAALFMAVTRTVIRNLATSGQSPAQMLHSANTTLLENNGEQAMFVTLFIGHYNTRTGHLRYANAAHPIPYRMNGSGHVERFGNVTGSLVGILDDQREFFVEEHEAQLEVGEGLMLYTDGVTEARSPTGEFFGDESMRAVLSRLGGQSAHHCCAATAEEVTQFQRSELSDDVTLLMLRRMQ